MVNDTVGFVKSENERFEATRQVALFYQYGATLSVYWIGGMMMGAFVFRKKVLLSWMADHGLALVMITLAIAILGQIFGRHYYRKYVQYIELNYTTISITQFNQVQTSLRFNEIFKFTMHAAKRNLSFELKNGEQIEFPLLIKDGHVFYQRLLQGMKVKRT